MKKKIRASISISILMIICLGVSASAEELSIASFRNQVAGTNFNVNVVGENLNIEKQTGWQKINGSWYYVDNFGKKQIGWLKDNGKWYYLDNSGVMLHDVILDGYRLGSSGAWII